MPIQSGLISGFLLLEVLAGEQLSEVEKNERAQTEPSPLWKDRSGRLPETALSLTSSR